MKRTLLPAALALALIGSVAFAQQTQTTPANPPAGAPNGQWHHGHHHPNPQREAEFLTKKLNLSSDKTAQLEPIFATRDEQMKALFQNTALTPEQRHEQMKTIHQNTLQQLSTVLTPEQIQEMKQFHHGGHHGQWQGQGGQQQPANPS
jgi:periplasmic protein CpxP/Spy